LLDITGSNTGETILQNKPGGKPCPTGSKE
jgi:hypothetical protein